MTIFQAIILGLVQGFFEFLPVSSSGHLVLTQKIFGLTQGTLFFDSMLHIGTLFAVFFVFRKDILGILKKPFQKLTLLVVVATIPTVIIAILFKDFFEKSYGGTWLGFGFLATSLILFATKKIKPGKKTQQQMTIKDACIVGIMQGVAIMPGVSRSGSTIAGGLFAKLDKDFAAKFSFLMSIPAILGSAALQFYELSKTGFGTIEIVPVLVGVFCAAVSGFFAIRFMLKIIKKEKLSVFAIYTTVLGALVLLDQYVFHIFF